MLSDIKWIFFDLGSTLIDEREADSRRIKEMVSGTDITEEAYREKRLEMIRKGLNGDLSTIEFFGLTKTPWHSDDEMPYPDVVSVLTELKKRGYNLGVVANQNYGTEQRLSNWKLLQFFDVIAASAELRMAKPDPAIFEWALQKAECCPQDAVMIGDRMDNDMAPANRLGMHTVRLLRGLAAYHKPQSADEKPEYTISSLAELLDLLGDRFFAYFSGFPTHHFPNEIAATLNHEEQNGISGGYNGS
jgi:putative hydrolase of the HAD superfamily